MSLRGCSCHALYYTSAFVYYVLPPNIVGSLLFCHFELSMPFCFLYANLEVVAFYGREKDTYIVMSLVVTVT